MKKYFKNFKICFAASIMLSVLLGGCRQIKTMEPNKIDASEGSVFPGTEITIDLETKKEAAESIETDEWIEPSAEATPPLIKESTWNNQTGKVAEPEEAATMNKAVENILADNSLGFQYSEYDEESQVYIYYFNNSKVSSIYLDPKKYEETVNEFETKMNALCRSVLASWSSAGMDIHTEFIFLNSANPENLLFASFDGYTLYSAR